MEMGGGSENREHPTPKTQELRELENMILYYPKITTFDILYLGAFVKAL